MSDLFAKCALSGFQQVFQTQNQREYKRMKEKFYENGEEKNRWESRIQHRDSDSKYFWNLGRPVFLGRFFQSNERFSLTNWITTI